MINHPPAIWWIKRDFRLQDNIALTNALKENQYVLPVFVWETSLLKASETSDLHIRAQYTALLSIKKNLQKIGANVLILKGELAGTFEQLYQTIPFTSIYSHQETGSNITFKRDIRVKKWCKQKEITWHEYPQNAVARGRKIEKLDEHLWNSFMQLHPAKPITTMLWNQSLETICQRTSPSIIFHVDQDKVQSLSEDAGKRILNSFLLERGVSYWGSLSSPNTAWLHGSRLSPHLAWGTISLRQVFQAAQKRIADIGSTHIQWTNSLEAFCSRLYWHDHFMQKLESYPELEFEVSDKRYKNIIYENNDAFLQRWLEGTTGFPMIDATMRCMRTTGFVNFRMRAMTVSFAAYGLHLSWRNILYPFARLMADYEPGIHIYQVQMQSGLTKGASMRVYSPVKQLLDKDPHCIFIKKWIPELRNFSSADIYASSNNMEKFGISKAFQLKTYPLPIIHFAKKSQEMKTLLASFRLKKVEAKKQLAFL